MSDRPHIFLATPCFGGQVTAAYMQSVLGVMQVAGPAGFDLSHALLGHDALVTRCRNTLLGAFMEGTASHLLFVDSDIAFTPAQVVRLLRSGKDVVAGMYPIKSLNWANASLHQRRDGEDAASSCLMYVGRPCDPGERQTDDGLVTAIHAGTGFMMVSRTAVTRMIAAYPETGYRAIHAWPMPDGPERQRHALFETTIDPETGEYLSEDFGFCQRWRAIGGQVWLDTTSRLTHVGSYEYEGNPALRFAASAPARATTGVAA